MQSRAAHKQPEGRKQTFDAKKYFDDRRALVEKKLGEFLPADEPELLWESMRYSVLGGGKRLRALLCIAAFETVENIYIKDIDIDDLEISKVLPCACALEMVHAMSLVHDDLPCLDNDDFRRGKPTNHKVYGEATALLAGDALLMRAVEVLVGATPRTIDASALLEVAEALTRATGADGMVGGQIYDLIYTQESGSGEANKLAELQRNRTEINESVVEKIHSGKTCALIRFSLWSGARLAGASSAQLTAIEKFGDILGLAFQITDDLLDVTGDQQTLGKTPGKDEAADKATWIRLFGIDGAKAKLSELENEGTRLLNENGLNKDDFNALESLLNLAIHRKK